MIPEAIAVSARQRGTLLATALGLVVVLIDVSVVNVALDALLQEFHTGLTGLQWVVNSYTLAFAALLLTGGVLGDRFGARRVFVAGVCVFTAASLFCGLAINLEMLVVARLSQGLGAALLMPNSLSLLQKAYPDLELRSRAVGWWAAMGGVSMAVGPVIGGIFVTHIGWRSVFLINLPIGLLALFLTLRYAVPATGDPCRSLDLPGQISAIVALASLAVALAEAGRVGWEDLIVRAGFSLAFIGSVSFLYIERRSRSPMVPLSLFQNPILNVASIAGAIVNFVYYGLIFVFSLFFQVQQQLSPQLTGFAFLPMTLVLVLVNVAAGRLVGRFGARLMLTLGFSIAAIGYLLLLPVSITGAYVWLVFPMLIAATGMALVVPTIMNATISSVHFSRAGVASGVLNTARQVGGMLGVTIFGYLVRDMSPEAFIQGVRLSISLSAFLLLFAGSLSWLVLQRNRLVSHGRS